MVAEQVAAGDVGEHMARRSGLIERNHMVEAGAPWVWPPQGAIHRSAADVAHPVVAFVDVEPREPLDGRSGVT